MISYETDVADQPLQSIPAPARWGEGEGRGGGNRIQQNPCIEIPGKEREEEEKNPSREGADGVKQLRVCPDAEWNDPSSINSDV